MKTDTVQHTSRTTFTHRRKVAAQKNSKNNRHKKIMPVAELRAFPYGPKFSQFLLRGILDPPLNATKCSCLKREMFTQWSDCETEVLLYVAVSHVEYSRAYLVITDNRWIPITHQQICYIFIWILYIFLSITNHYCCLIGIKTFGTFIYS